MVDLDKMYYIKVQCKDASCLIPQFFIFQSQAKIRMMGYSFDDTTNGTDAETTPNGTKNFKTMEQMMLLLSKLFQLPILIELLKLD